MTDASVLWLGGLVGVVAWRFGDQDPLSWTARFVKSPRGKPSIHCQRCYWMLGNHCCRQCPRTQ